MREITVIAAAVIGAAVGFYGIGGGRGTPGEIIDNPERLIGNTSAMLWMIAGAVVLPWLTNRWIEHSTEERDPMSPTHQCSAFSSSKSPPIRGDSLGAAVHPIPGAPSEPYDLGECGIARRSAVDLC
jgi:hypothetical protein